MVKITKLKSSDKVALRAAVEHILKFKFNQWISPRRMQAYMIGLTADVTEEEVRQIMDSIYLDSLECPWKTFSRAKGLCYKCVAFHTPN